jgi:hypothetical protein
MNSVVGNGGYELVARTMNVGDGSGHGGDGQAAMAAKGGRPGRRHGQEEPYAAAALCHSPPASSPPIFFVHVMLAPSLLSSLNSLGGEKVEVVKKWGGCSGFPISMALVMKISKP